MEIRAETRPVPRAVAVTRQHANLQLRRSSAAAPSRIHNSKFSSYYSQHYSNSDLLFKFAATIQIREYEQCPSTHREWLNHFTIQGKRRFHEQIFYARWMSERAISEYKIDMSLSQLANLVLSEYAYAEYF